MPRQQEIQVLAEMVANVLTVDVAPGDSVSVGDTVILLESMKMETVLNAPFAARVKELLVSSGSQVETGAQRVSTRRGGHDRRPGPAS